MAETIGTAYIQIEPTTQGLSGSISNVLDGEATKAGASAGGKLSSALGSAAKIGVGAIAGLTTAVTGAGVALTNAASETAQYGDDIDKMSQKLGVSAKTYQEYDYVMQLAGTSMSDMGTGLKTLTNKLQDATSGSEESADMFRQLGLSMDDLSSMSREDVFKAVIEGFQGMEDSTERAALANDLFGKSGQNLTPLFNTTSEETQKLIESLNDMGSVMSDDAVKASADFQDALTTMQTAFSGVKNVTMSELLPSFTTVMDGITGLVTGVEGSGDKIAEGMQGISDSITKAIPKLMDGFSSIIDSVIKIAPDIIKSLAKGIIDSIPKIMPSLVELVKQITQGIIELLPQLVKAGLEVILELAKGIADSLPKLIPTIVDVVLNIVETLIDNVDMLIDASIAIILGLADGLIDALPKLIEKAPEIIIKLVGAFVNNAPKLMEASLELIIKLAEGLIKAVPQLLAAVPELVMGLVEKFGEFGTNLANVGRDFVAGIKEGIASAWENLKSWLGDLCGGLVDKIKETLKIGSPSKIMRDEVGQWIPAGMAVGIETNADSVTDAMDDLTSDVMVASKDISKDYSSKFSASTSHSTDESSIGEQVETAIKSALENVGVYMDSTTVGRLVAGTVNQQMGRLNVRRV